MTPELIVNPHGGTPFEDGTDRGRVVISGEQTGGAYSLMEWTIASRGNEPTSDHRDFGPHQHAAIDEVFVVRSGSLAFLVGERITRVTAGDVIRVPAGTRHGYCNTSGRDVEMIVWFAPGGSKACS